MGCNTCGVVCSCRGQFTQLRGRELAKTLAQQLVCAVDQIRDLNTVFGLRPYIVSIIRTLWSDGERGAGTESISAVTPILPTPKLVAMDGLTEILNPIGLDENGMVQIIQISGAYTEDQLRGLDAQGREPGDAEQVFYEIEFPRVDGSPGEKRRFTLRGAPNYRPAGFQWLVRLEKAIQNRDRNGDPT